MALVEQGFVIHSPSAQQTVLELRVDRGWARQERLGTVSLIDTYGRVVKYQEARAWDAEGRDLAVRMSADAGAVRL